MDLLEILNKPKGIREIYNDLNHKYNMKVLKVKLNMLIKEEKVYLTYDKKYVKLLTGTYIYHSSNYGFIKNDIDKTDIYCDKSYSMGANNDDEVLYYIYYIKRNDRPYSHVVKILNRAECFLTGIVISRIDNGYKKLAFKTKDENSKIYNFDKKYDNLVEGMVLYCKKVYKDNKEYVGFIDVLGNIDDPGIEITEIAAIYGFNAAFNDNVKEEVRQIKQIVSEDELKGRTDFTNLNIITIDGDDSKDFDDAVNVRVDNEGNYLLGVYIADVSDYVTYNSALDQEAYHRGTSVYLADRVIPMLPHELSNGICSLNEGVIRKVLAVTIKIDSNGKILDSIIEEGFIKSAHRMTYNNVNKMLNNDIDIINKYEDIYEMILDMNKLHQILRRRNEKKGSLEFEVYEYKFTLNPDGSPKGIVIRERAEAEKIIEDFMICANEVVATTLSQLDYPCLYRVHDEPDQDKLFNVFKMLKDDGVEINIPKSEIKPKMIQDALNKIENRADSVILNNLLLRSMAKAKYQKENIGHYGLALTNYCHFTSPIRRYPDLIVHRIIKELIIHKNNDFNKYYNYYENNLEQIGYDTSLKERKAIECEREVNDMLAAWLAEGLVSREFDGIITSITKFGIFVTLENGIEGLVHLKNISGYCDYNEESQEIENIDDGRIFRLGDRHQVIVIGASRISRKVDFMFIEDYMELEGES